MKPLIRFKTATQFVLDDRPDSSIKRTSQQKIVFSIIALVFWLALCANAQAPPGALWYNGDLYDLAQDNQINTGTDNIIFYPITQIYDDFTVPPPFGWNITEVFSDNLLYNGGNGAAIVGAVWEIRQGVSAGNPGEWRVHGLNAFLPPGTYHLNVTPIVSGLYSAAGNSFTTGTDCVGTPCGNNGNAFNNAPNVAYWQPVDGDFAMGLVGNSNNNPQ
jgi:hypothetical protein